MQLPRKLSRSSSLGASKLARTQCRRCGASISNFALACAECQAPDQPNPVATIAALLAIVALGTAVAVGTAAFGPHPAQQAVSERAAAGSAPIAAGTEEYGWIMDTMAGCEAESKRQPDLLRFVIL